MKRPLATVGTVVLVSLAVSFVFKGLLPVILAVTLFAAGVVTAVLKRRTIAVMLIASALSMSVGILSLYFSEAAAECHAGKTYTVTAIVTATEARNSKEFIYADIKTLDGKTTRNIKIKCYVFQNIDVGDEITATVKFSDDFYSVSPSYIEFYGETESIDAVNGHKYALLSLFDRIKTKARFAVTSVLSGEEGLLAAAIVTGDKSLIPTEMKLEFQRAGVSHILVVSGLHVTFMLSTVYLFLEKTKLHRYAILFLTTTLAVALVTLYGFTPSVIRACVMAVIVFGGKAFYRKPDSITSLVFAGLVIVLFDLGAVLDPSFLLSFGCCFAILVVYPFISKRVFAKKASGVRRAVEGLFKSVLLTLSVSLTLLPICVLLSMPTSLVAPFTNLLIVWTVPLELGFTLLLVLSSFLGLSPLAYLFGLGSGVVSKYIIAVSRFSAGFSFASVSLHDSFLKLWILFAVLIIVVYLAFGKRERLKVVASCACAVLLAGILSKYIATANKPVLTLYRGSCAVATQGGESALIIYDIKSDEIEHLRSFLDYRLTPEPKYVIILNDLSDTAELAITEAFKGSRIFSAFDVFGSDNVKVRNRTVLKFGGFEILTNESSDCKVLYGFTTAELCAKLPDDTQECEILIYWRDVNEKNIIHRGYPIRLADSSYCDERGAGYTYYDTVSVYFNNYLDFKAVIE